MEKQDEEKIIKACQRGKLEQFGQLYDAYIRKIYNFIYYKTHHKETAEDLTSQTFIKALDKIESFDNNKGYFSSWIYQIARNSVIDFYRTKKNNINIDDVWDLSSNDDLERDIDLRQKLENVRQYLKKLKTEQREIIILRVWQNLSYKEISEIMGKSEPSAKMIFSRAIRTLRKEMPLSLLLYFLSIVS